MFQKSSANYKAESHAGSISASTIRWPATSTAVLNPTISFASEVQIPTTMDATGAFLVVNGFCAQITLVEGRRRIVGLSLAGDIINIEALLGGRPDYATVTIGTVQLAEVDDPQGVLSGQPQMMLKLTSHALRAASIGRLWAFRLAALDAPQSIAHLLCEVRHRLAHKGLAERVLRTPFTQTDIADMCGISAIHANRALGRLRDSGLGEMRRGDFYASSWSALEEYAQFEPGGLRAVFEPLGLGRTIR